MMLWSYAPVVKKDTNDQAIQMEMANNMMPRKKCTFSLLVKSKIFEKPVASPNVVVLALF
jgi:hypothetical protein